MDEPWWQPFRPWAEQRADGVMHVRLALLEDRPAAVAPATKKARAVTPPPPEDQEDDDEEEEEEPLATTSKAVAPKRSRVKTVKGAVDRYIREWGGGNMDELKKRLMVHLTARDAKKQIAALKDWLTTTWYATNVNRESPTLSEIVKQFGTNYLSAEKWASILKYEAVVRKKAGAKMQERTRELAPLEKGEWKLRISFKQFSEKYSYLESKSAEVFGWNLTQPLLIEAGIAVYNDPWMENILRSLIPDVLLIDKTRLYLTATNAYGGRNAEEGPTFDVDQLFLSNKPGPFIDRGALTVGKEDSLLPLRIVRTGKLLILSSLFWDDLEIRDFETAENGTQSIALLRMKNDPNPKTLMGSFNVVVAFFKSTSQILDKAEGEVGGIYIYK